MLRAAIFAGGPSTVAVLLDIHHTPWFDHTRLANHDMSAIVTHCDCDAARCHAFLHTHQNLLQTPGGAQITITGGFGFSPPAIDPRFSRWADSLEKGCCHADSYARTPN
jgi:hypothetical protein